MNEVRSQNAVSRTSLLISTLRGRVGGSLFILFMIAFTYIRFDLMKASFLSLVLTLIYSIMHLQLNPVYMRAALIEYWLASFGWCSIMVMGCWLLFQKKGNKLITEKLFFAISPAWTPNRSTLKKSTFGIYTLSIFLGIAVLGPFLAPLDPINQGDLETTRLLAPLQTAMAWEDISITVPTEAAYSSIEKGLRDANNFLLARKVNYTRSEQQKVERKEQGTKFHVLFLFGTDGVGRDVFSRVIYGTRISLGIGIIVAALSMILGMGIGFLSGIIGGMVDKFLMRVIDVLLSLPPLVLIISLFSVLGGSIEVLIIALALSGWMGVARLVRGEVLKLREQEFILAAKLLGVSHIGIIRNHLLPNILPTILTASVFQLVNAIMGEAALSFLGLGIQPPTASWGNMIGESTIYLRSAWWIGIFPGIALSFFAISAQLVAEGIQECQK